MRKKLSNVLLGLLFIALGIIYIGSVFDLWEFSIFFDGWWTLFIIVPCAFSFVSSGFQVSNFIGLGVGVILLLFCRDILDFETALKIVFPFALVCVGVSILFKTIFGEKKPPEIISKTPNKKNATAIFGGSEPNFKDVEFNGITSSAIFGGVDLNLKSAIINKDCTITCTAIFGGIDIVLPSSVKLSLADTSILGGVDNKFVPTTDENAPTVTINSTCIFGGLEIK